MANTIQGVAEVGGRHHGTATHHGDRSTNEDRVWADTGRGWYAVADHARLADRGRRRSDA